MALTPTRKLLPNWALAGLLGAFVGGTYWYSLRAVGDDSAQVSSPYDRAGPHLRRPCTSLFVRFAINMLTSS